MVTLDELLQLFGLGGLPKRRGGSGHACGRDVVIKAIYKFVRSPRTVGKPRKEWILLNFRRAMYFASPTDEDLKKNVPIQIRASVSHPTPALGDVTNTEIIQVPKKKG